MLLLFLLTGVIQTQELLDHETTNHYWLTIYGTDLAVVPQSSFMEVYIEVSLFLDCVLFCPCLSFLFILICSTLRLFFNDSSVPNQMYDYLLFRLKMSTTTHHRPPSQSIILRSWRILPRMYLLSRSILLDVLLKKHFYKLPLSSESC